MGVCFIGWPNRIDEAELSGGDWSTDLPLSNLQTRQITRVARTTGTDTAETQFSVDLGKERSLAAIALINHNLSGDAQWRVLLGTTAGDDDIYSGEWVNAWVLSFDDDMLEWGDYGWWEGVTDTEDAIKSPFAAIWMLPGFLSARYVTIEIADAYNEDNYVQIGRVFIGGGYLPTVNADHEGFADKWEDLGTVWASDSGTEFFNLRRCNRSVQFTLPYVSHSEAATLYELQRRAGTTGEVLWVPDIDDAEAQQRYGFLGRLRQLSPIEYPWINARRVSFEIKEIM